jgi:hypothetical protein
MADLTLTGAEVRLADALAAAINRRLGAGVGFIRVPELVSPLPVDLLLGRLGERSGVRAAVFVDDWSPDHPPVAATNEVHVAIDWRNDPAVTDDLVVLGDLERDRASGLSELPTISADQVRENLFRSLIAELQPADPAALLVRLLQCLATQRAITDLRAAAEYCDAVARDQTRAPDIARRELWRLGLFPDTASPEIDAAQLRRNADLVSRVRSMDATSLQRLVGHLSDVAAGDYERLRRFASTGDLHVLEGLELQTVVGAFRAVTERPTRQETIWEEPSETIAQVVRGAAFDEVDFLKQVSEGGEANSADNTIRVANETFEWERVNVGRFADLLADPQGDADYPDSAGSIERLPEDEPTATPGRGDVAWRRLTAVASDLEKLERRINDAPNCGGVVARLIKDRRDLMPFLDSIAAEGVSLFIGSSRLRASAESLVAGWVELWELLQELANRLPESEKNYVMRVAEELSLTDLRVVAHGTEVTAYMLPLHPVILEPRVRAARLFIQTPYLPADFYELVTSSLDPAMPSITVRVEETSISLGYAGTWNSLPLYSRHPHEADAGDVPRTLQQIIGRFISVHPYAELSLSVAVVDPAPRVARELFRWLGSSNRVQRARLDVFVTRSNADELRGALDEAAEELVSGEIAGAAERFSYAVHRLEQLRDLPESLDELEGSPHLLILFDLAEVDQSTVGALAGEPSLGSLVTEWDFSTNPLEDFRPVIRPRSGSNQLTELISGQASLFGSSIPTQERSPLLAAEAERVLESLSDRATWVTICEGVSALVPPLRVGGLDLLGRLRGASHVAFTYSKQVALLLEPILRYLQKSTWLSPERDALVQFLMGTVRRAMPEGLLGFFKTQGALSSEAVLGRLGLAAVLAYIDQESPPDRLIVSLDTDGARRWLGLRDGPEIRADLLGIEIEGENCEIEVIEIKARTQPFEWNGTPPEALTHAREQVHEMERLLRQMFNLDPPDPFTPSRREILKRQVFLEALQQWEHLRLDEPEAYENRLERLNRLFDSHLVVRVTTRIFAVSPQASEAPTERQISDTAVTLLGVDWFKRALERTPGATIEIPTSVLDELGDLFADEPPTAEERAIRASASPTTEETIVGRPREHLETGSSVTEAPAETAAAREPQEEVPEPSATEAEAHELASRFRAALLARKAPFTAIREDRLVVGPSVIQVPFSVPAGVKLSVIEGQEEDIARDLGVEAVRISNWPGEPGLAVAELPRRDRSFPDVTSLERPHDPPYVTAAIGAQINYSPLWISLDDLPHLLIGGTTGSGKSVFLRSLLWQLTSLYGPDEIDLVLIDAKGLADYLDFVNAPHFKSESDFHLGVVGALELFEHIIEEEIPRRTKIFREYAAEALKRPEARHITRLRDLIADAREQNTTPPLRPLVVIIDEFAELVLASTDRKRFETSVTRFNQIARAVGGHLIAATQRPSTDVVTGLMKSNFARVALRVQQSVDSRVILDENGAEALLGKGDLLFKSADMGLVRLQGYAASGPYSY